MIKLGVIGMSPGNAHPSSWSAIVNGTFNKEEIISLGYPAVAEYLEANQPTLGIPGARVTHVLTQSTQLSEKIAATSGIENIAKSAADMIRSVDAVLLNRDDPENHVSMARPYIEAGIPIFLDKPLCATQSDLEYFTNAVKDGKFIMSCSSMRYSDECMSVKASLKSLGTIQLVTAVGKKDWFKYGIHLLEGIVSVLDDPKPESVRNTGKAGKHIVNVCYEKGIEVTLHLFEDLTPTSQISFFGSEAWRMVEIRNSYSMFRNNIIEFIRSVNEGKPRIEFYKTVRLMKVLIAAEESLQKGGELIKF